MSTATTTSHDTGQSQSHRSTTQPNNTPITQTTPNAAQRLRTTMAAVKLAFTWLGVRKTLAPEQRTTAARAFHADRELLSASKLILDLKHPAYRAVAAVRSEASGYWRTVTLPFPEAGIRLLPQNSLGLFATTMQTYRERLQESARELAAQYDTIKSEAERRLGTLFNASDYPSTLDGSLPRGVCTQSQVQARRHGARDRERRQAARGRDGRAYGRRAPHRKLLRRDSRDPKAPLAVRRVIDAACRCSQSPTRSRSA